jgi:hypothetical protein
VRARWFSLKALLLHVTLLAWLPGCAWLTNWQFARARTGNALSYVYVVEWPALAVFGVWGWWMLLHTEKPTEAQVAARAALEQARRAEARAAAAVVAASTADDPAMIRYNEHLRALAEEEER